MAISKGDGFVSRKERYQPPVGKADVREVRGFVFSLNPHHKDIGAILRDNLNPMISKKNVCANLYRPDKLGELEWAVLAALHLKSSKNKAGTGLWVALKTVNITTLFKFYGLVKGESPATMIHGAIYRLLCQGLLYPMGYEIQYRRSKGVHVTSKVEWKIGEDLKDGLCFGLRTAIDFDLRGSLEHAS